MAGLIAALFGGRSRPPDPDPLPGVGGYRLPTGRTGEGGYPGTTSPTRTFKGTNPRGAKIRSDRNTGWENGLGDDVRAQQSSYRGDVPGAHVRGPRATPRAAVRITRIEQTLQSNSPAEFFGGPMLSTGPGNDTAGGNPGSRAFHGTRDTETPPTRREPIIARDVPGSQNVRNDIALRYRAVPGDAHTYLSAPRADQAGYLSHGQAADGNVHPEQAASPVTVPSRFRFAGGGHSTWYMQREMPYVGRGNGARGADLNGQRYYGRFNDGQQFMNGGQGNYGIARERGGKRPVSFTEPAPWTANYYDTTESVGTTDAPGNATQAPSAVYVSPASGRAGNGTGRTG